MFIPDPDPIFFPFRIPDPGVKKAPDPGSGSPTLINIFTTWNRSKNMPTKVQKPFFEMQESRFICSFWSISIFYAPGSRSAFSNTDPDPVQPNECGSGFTTLLQEHIQGEWGNPKCIIAQR
jgi:hypothetical protein